MVIQHSLLSMNAARQLNINTGSKSKSAEKLSSGYRVNRAADDAATLTISEGMRRQIRGLSQGTDNTQDGVSFVKVADQAMSEVSELMQRMSELTIKSLNGSYTRQDRDAMQAEFDELQSQIDTICKDTEMNTLPVFEQHEDTYHGIKGNRYWMNSQPHLVEDGHNQLSFTIKDPATGADATYSVSVPAGIYTTQELADEIDDALTSQLPDHPEFVFEYSKDGFCNLHYENGEDIESVDGGLSYLFFDNHDGGSFGSLMGTTEFAEAYPLHVTNANNELNFYIEDILGLSSTKVSLRITPGEYSREQMVDYLNNALAAKHVTGISASEFGDKSIQLSGDKYLVTGLKGNMFEIDDGNFNSVFYDNVKYGSVSNTKGFFKGNAYLTTDVTDTAHNRFKIDSTNHELKIRVNAPAGTPYTTITLPDGDYTAQEMSDLLNAEFMVHGFEADVNVNHAGSFDYLSIASRISGNGSAIDIASSSSCYSTLFQKTEYFYGNSVSPTNGVYNSTPPKYSSGKVVPVPLTVTAPGNSLKLEVTDSSSTDTYTLNLAAGTYATLDDIIAALNSDINSKGGIRDKIIATNDGGSLAFTTGTDGGSINRININKDTSGSIYDNLFTIEGSALNNFNQTATGIGSFTLPEDLPSPVEISGDNTLHFIMDGIVRTVTIPDGSYSQEDFANQISNQLTSSSITVQNPVNLSGQGTQTNIEGTTIPGNSTPATIRLGTALASSITIDSSSTRLTMNVNGTDKTINLTAGTYSRQALINELNYQFEAGGIGVTADLSSNCLTFTTQKEGSGASLKLNSSTGGSALAAIAGSTTTTVGGATASIAGGKLVISGATPGRHTVGYGSSNGGSLAEMLLGTHTTYTYGKPTDRKITEKFAKIDGVNLTQPITINSDNRKVLFKYSHDGTDYNIDFDLDEKDYTFAELTAALKAGIAADTVTPIPLDVNVDSFGVTIAAQTPGSQYMLSDFSGGFHSRVISGSKLIMTDRNPECRNGVQNVNSPYIVGRQDVATKPITVKPGENDELKIDFTAPDAATGRPTEYTLELKLDAGTYQGAGLVNAIQAKLDAQLTHYGFTAGTIKAGIGGITSGVVGANDDSALNFIIPSDAPNMKAGTYKIDGVRGNAAYYMFYKTLGDPVPAYTVGTKDISGGVTMTDTNNVFTFTADSVDYSYTFPPGHYTAEEFMNLFNDMLEHGDDTGQPCDVRALPSGNNMKLAFSVSGKHSLKPIGGPAKSVIFFEDEGRINAQTDKKLQVGLEKTDAMDLETLHLNTNYLGINTICITGEKYSKKALKKLETAMEKVNHARTLYGARQNRLEHTINANNNTGENLTAGESRMRDTDIAAEMVAQAKYRILEQFGQSVTAQANQSPTRLLQLLQES